MKRKITIGVIIIVLPILIFLLLNMSDNPVKEDDVMIEHKELIQNASNENKNIDLLRKYLFESPFVRDDDETDENETLNAANLILEDRILFPAYCKDPENNDCAMDYTEGINWTHGEGIAEAQQRSFKRQLHGLFFLNDLAEAYLLTGDPAYVDKGYEIIETWKNDNPIDNPSDPMAWHDEGSAKRLLALINFFDAGSDVLSEDNKKMLFVLMEQHAELLASDSFYSKNTNHGMFQDEGLIAFSKYFYKIKELDEYYQLAVERLNDYYNYVLSDEYVHLEHSPSYHQVVGGSIKAHAEIFKGFGDNEGAENLYQIYDNMADYGTYVIKPDGQWPRIGDTYEQDIPSSTMWTGNEKYRYTYTSGSEGSSPNELNKVYPDAGYAIFRDRWTNSNQGTYIFFTAAYHTSYHKHSDDLSLWIYKDQDIITEAGPYSYAMQDPITIYAYSSFAHNTLIVDDTGLPRVDEMYEKTFMEDFDLSNPIKPSATGVNNRYEGVSHKRNVVYDKEKQNVQVNDTITSDEDHNFKLLWHVAPGITPVIDNGIVKLMKNEENIAEMNIIGDVDFDIRQVYGDEDPIYKSWYFTYNEEAKNTESVNTYTIIIEFNGKDGAITTNFTLY